MEGQVKQLEQKKQALIEQSGLGHWVYLKEANRSKFLKLCKLQRAALIREKRENVLDKG